MGRKTSMPIQALTIQAAGVIAANRCVDADGDYSTANGTIFGATVEGADAANDYMAVVTDGGAALEAEAAIVQFAQVTVGTGGKIKTAASGHAINGVALEAATGDGDVILVKLKYNGVVA